MRSEFSIPSAKFAPLMVLHATWGLLQNLAGIVTLAVVGRGARRHWFRAAYITEWPYTSGLSLGAFIFVPKNCSASLYVHEYGHTIQSLMLGPVYLLAIGLPSLVWARSPYLCRRRTERGTSYYSFWPERWANHLGERVTGNPAPRY